MQQKMEKLIDYFMALTKLLKIKFMIFNALSNYKILD